MEYIVCKLCNVEKHRDEYYAHKEKISGKMSACKSCHLARTKVLKDKAYEIYKKERDKDKFVWNGIENKCKKCYTIKPLKNFSKNPCVKHGYSNVCIKCVYAASDKEKRRERDLKNKEKVKEINRRAKKKYRLTHPEVRRDDRKRRRRVKPDAETKDFLLMLGKDPCSYCGSYDNPSIDHIVPLHKDGENHYSNLTAACITCNTAKGKKDLLNFLLTRK